MWKDLDTALLGPELLQAIRLFHTGMPNLVPILLLPESGGKVHHGLTPEEFFQFFSPKTSVRGPYVLGTHLSYIFYLNKYM